MSHMFHTLLFITFFSLCLSLDDIFSWLFFKSVNSKKENTKRKPHVDIPTAWHSQTDEIKDIEKMSKVAGGRGNI